MGSMKREALVHNLETTQVEVKVKTLDNILLNLEAALSTH